MKLLPEQIEKINNRLADLDQEYKMMLEQKSEDTVFRAWGIEGFDDLDTVNFKYRIDKILSDMKELRDILKDSEELTEANADVITFGSRFTATMNFDGEEETDNFILLDSHDYKEAGVTVVTTKSPFGMSVIGKKENDSFSYDMNGFSVKGVVNSINKAKVKTLK